MIAVSVWLVHDDQGEVNAAMQRTQQAISISQRRKRALPMRGKRDVFEGQPSSKGRQRGDACVCDVAVGAGVLIDESAQKEVGYVVGWRLFSTEVATS